VLLLPILVLHVLVLPALFLLWSLLCFLSRRVDHQLSFRIFFITALHLCTCSTLVLPPLWCFHLHWFLLLHCLGTFTSLLPIPLVLLPLSAPLSHSAHLVTLSQCIFHKFEWCNESTAPWGCHSIVSEQFGSHQSTWPSPGRRISSQLWWICRLSNVVPWWWNYQV